MTDEEGLQDCCDGECAADLVSQEWNLDVPYRGAAADEGRMAFSIFQTLHKGAVCQ